MYCLSSSVAMPGRFVDGAAQQRIIVGMECQRHRRRKELEQQLALGMWLVERVCGQIVSNKQHGHELARPSDAIVAHLTVYFFYLVLVPVAAIGTVFKNARTRFKIWRLHLWYLN